MMKQLSKQILIAISLALALTLPVKAQQQNPFTSWINPMMMNSFGTGGYNGNPMTLMTNPANWINPNMYMQFIDPRAYLAMMNPMTYAQLLNPMSYMQMMNPMAYMQMMNPGNYAGWIEPETYTRSITELLSALQAKDKNAFDRLIEQLKQMSEKITE